MITLLTWASDHPWVLIVLCISATTITEQVFLGIAAVVRALRRNDR